MYMYMYVHLLMLSSDYGYKHANGITGPCIRDDSVSLNDPCAARGVSVYYKSQG